ncbi:MAG TPA: nicotinate (nicotinamide) nucleotide adenylyltransferase [Clostridiales bacterium]|nr:nicotinate (nicotinamide) nucleotide adenylyltransferase [Clostridiales bacterium]
MRLIIFGGTFDPPHNGHVELISSLNFSNDDKVIILPNYIPPHKSADASSEDRLNMCKLAFADLEVCDYEIKKGGASYTYQTLQHFQKEYSLDCDHLIYIIGADSMRDLKNWGHPHKLSRLATFLVFRRPHYNNVEKDIKDFKDLYGGNFILSDFIGQDISSTEIRVRNAFDQAGDYVPKGVYDYINQKGLYQKYRAITSKYSRFGLSQKRINHTLSVTLTALKLGYVYQVESEKIILAALLHDIGKNLSLKKAYELGLNISYKTIELPAVCRHADFGYEIAKTFFGIKDEEVLNAIKYHTTGRPDMTLLEKIILLSDYFEPTRQTPGIDKIAQVAQTDIDKAVAMALKDNLNYLKQQNYEIAPITISAYKYYQKENEFGI